MPRRPKYPPYVNIKIPRDLVEVWETNLMDILFTEKEAEIAKRIINYIKENERIYPDEYKNIINGNVEKVRYFRVLRKMVSLGLLKRGKDSSYILSEEFALKLGAMLEKWKAITG